MKVLMINGSPHENGRRQQGCCFQYGELRLY